MVRAPCFYLQSTCSPHSNPALIRIYDKRSDPALDISSSVAASADGKSSVVFDFDQVDRHRKFWDYLRDKDWQAVATFFDKKVISAYHI